MPEGNPNIERIRSALTAIDQGIGIEEALLQYALSAVDMHALQAALEKVRSDDESRQQPAA